MKEVFIVDALRTPIGDFGGSLKSVSAVEMGAILIKKLLSKNNLENDEVDGIVMGNVLQAGAGQNPARQCAIRGGLGNSTPALTVNKVCGSGLKAIDIAAKEIILNNSDIYIAGGMESMSSAPYLLSEARWGYRMGDKKLIDSMIKDGLWCPYNDIHMGCLVDQVAEELKISRKAQDSFSLESHQKAIKSQDRQRFDSEIVPVKLTDKKGNKTTFLADEHPRRDTSLEALSKLKSVFTANGTITAGNASGITDGAAALILSSKKGLDNLNATPLAEIVAVSEVSGDPKYFGLMPIGAIEKVLEETKLKLKDMELIELNEAFAAQTLAVISKLKIDADIVNVNGGAIALGHPIGASGSRIVVTMLNEMVKRKVKYGLASLCIGSGEGMAIIVKRL